MLVRLTGVNWIILKNFLFKKIKYVYEQHSSFWSHSKGFKILETFLAILENREHY